MKIDLAKYAGLILQLLIIAGLFYLYQRLEAGEKANREYWEGSKGKKFKTDTVHVEIDYEKLPRPIYKNQVPPAVVWTFNEPTFGNYKVKLKNDSLLQVIDTLTQRITNINTQFLTRYPEAPKILFGTFTADSLTIDLLDISGGVNRMQYGVNYQRFHYQWVNGELRADNIPFNYVKRKMGIDVFANTGYDWTLTKPILGADVSLHWDRLRVKGQSWVTVEHQPQFYFQTTLGFKIR